MVANVSRITHRDLRSVAGGIAIAKAAQLLASSPRDDPVSFCPAIAEAIAGFSPEFAEWVTRLPGLLREPEETAVRAIAWAGMPAPEFESPIITPFVIPTVLAALWCVCHHPDSWSTAVTSCHQIGGDVDTKGQSSERWRASGWGQSHPEHLRLTVQGRGKLEVLTALPQNWSRCVSRLSLLGGLDAPIPLGYPQVSPARAPMTRLPAAILGTAFLLNIGQRLRPPDAGEYCFTPGRGRGRVYQDGKRRSPEGGHAVRDEGQVKVVTTKRGAKRGRLQEKWPFGEGSFSHGLQR